MNVDPSGCFPFWAVMCPATASVVLTPHLLHRPVTLLHDVYQLTEKDDIKVIVNKEKGEIEIANSHKIITPEVQYLYSLYLNHVNPDTKDVIKGTTRGMQSEWMAHNIGYTILRTAKLTFSAFGKETTSVEGHMGAASPANIGGTVFDNPNDKIGKALIGYNFIMAPIATILDFFVWKFST